MVLRELACGRVTAAAEVIPRNYAQRKRVIDAKHERGPVFRYSPWPGVGFPRADTLRVTAEVRIRRSERGAPAPSPPALLCACGKTSAAHAPA